MDKKRILIIEDDREIRKGITILLDSGEYSFIEASNGEEGLSLMSEDIDLVILDIMMPGADGIEVCRQIRQEYCVPVLFLSAKAQETDKLIGLRTGADDYLTKPFSYIELEARIKALLRRYFVYRGCEHTGSMSGDGYIELDDLRICVDHNEVQLKGQEIGLTETEYQILLMLAKKPNRPHSVKAIYEAVWQEPFFYGANRTVMVHVKNLRAKIEDTPWKPARIITIWGKGYQYQKRVQR